MSKMRITVLASDGFTVKKGAVDPGQRMEQLMQRLKLKDDEYLVLGSERLEPSATAGESG